MHFLSKKWLDLMLLITSYLVTIAIGSYQTLPKCVSGISKQLLEPACADRGLIGIHCFFFLLLQRNACNPKSNGYQHLLPACLHNGIESVQSCAALSIFDPGTPYNCNLNLSKLYDRRQGLCLRSFVFCLHNG